MVYSTRKSSLALAAGAALMLFSAWGANSSRAGGTTFGYEALPPITHANLTIFPVVAAAGRSHDTRNFLTLDEGLRSGDVVVTEAGSIAPLMRRRRRGPLGERPIIPWGDGAQVNRLMLVNNSDRPLILLAGEIVTGGKQDRVVGKDRIVPPQSDPIDLSVFCVEPGRWVARPAAVPHAGIPPTASARSAPRWRSRAFARKRWPTKISKKSGMKCTNRRREWPPRCRRLQSPLSNPLLPTPASWKTWRCNGTSTLLSRPSSALTKTRSANCERSTRWVWSWP